MTTRRIIHAFDAGPALALQPLGLESRFHGWRGKSGRRYLSTVFTGEGCRFLGEGLYLVICRDRDGALIPARIGLMDGASATMERRRLNAAEVHVIFLEGKEAQAICDDLASLSLATVHSCADQPQRQSS